MLISCNLRSLEEPESQTTYLNPYSTIGEAHSAGLKAVLVELEAEANGEANAIHISKRETVYENLLKFISEATIQYSVENNIPVNIENLENPFNTIWQYQYSANLSKSSSGDAFSELLQSEDLTEQERVFLYNLNFALNDLKAGEAPSFDEKTNNLVGEVISAYPAEQYEKVLSTIAVAVDSREYWDIEQNKIDWLNAIAEVTILELGLDPNDYDTNDIINSYIDCASLGNIAGADAAGALVGAAAGGVGAGPGAVTGSAALITACAVSAVVDWLF